MDIFLQLLDLRSFPSLWYWLFMITMWAAAIHHPLGVPYGLVENARHDPQMRADAVSLAQVNTRRTLTLAEGRVVPVVLFAVLGAVGVLGFGYGMGFCQAVSLLAWPMAGVLFLRLGAARRVAATTDGDTILRILRWHHYTVLAIAILSMVFTVLWGTVHNILSSPFY